MTKRDDELCMHCTSKVKTKHIKINILSFIIDEITMRLFSRFEKTPQRTLNPV